MPQTLSPQARSFLLYFFGKHITTIIIFFIFIIAALLAVVYDPAYSPSHAGIALAVIPGIFFYLVIAYIFTRGKRKSHNKILLFILAPLIAGFLAYRSTGFIAMLFPGQIIVIQAHAVNSEENYHSRSADDYSLTLKYNNQQTFTATSYNPGYMSINKGDTVHLYLRQNFLGQQMLGVDDPATNTTINARYFPHGYIAWAQTFM